MSEDPDSEGRQPRKKMTTSTGMLDSFRSLTGGRTAGLRLPTPNASLNAHKANTSAPDTNLPLSPSPRRQSMQDFDIDFYGFAAAHGGFVGAPEGFDDMIGELGTGWPTEMRARAARKITTVLEHYPINNVLPIWYRARDIVDFIATPEACHAGYALLVACAKCTTLGPSERDIFLSCVENFLTLNGEKTQTLPQEYLGYQIQVLSALTDHGKDLHSLEDRIVPVVLLLFSATYAYARDARRKARALKFVGPTFHHEPLEQTFEYTSDLIKHSSEAVGEHGAEKLVEEVLMICKKTNNERDIQVALNTLETVFKYSSPTDKTLWSTLEIICKVHTIAGALQSESWEVMHRLLMSPRSNTIIDALLKIMSKAPDYPPKESTIVRGAVQLMGRWIEEHQFGKLSYPTVPSLLASLKVANTLRSSNREMHMLRMLKRLVMRREQVEELLEGAGWDDFTTVLLQCVNMQVDWSQPYYAGSPVLGRTELLTHELAVISKSSTLVEPEEFARVELESIVSNLLDFTADMGYENKLIVIKFSLQTMRPLSDNIVNRVTAFHLEQNLLSPSTSGWITNCTLLLDNVFLDRGRSVECRKAILKVVLESYELGSFCGDPAAPKELMSLVAQLHSEVESELVSELVELSVRVGMAITKETIFEQLMQVLLSAIFAPGDQFNLSAAEEKNTLNVWSKEGPYQTAREMIGSKVAVCLVRLFLRTVNTSVWKCQRVFGALLEVAASSSPHPRARITVLKVLFRMRSDVNHSIYITPDTLCQPIAAALCRTVDSARNSGDIASFNATTQEELPKKQRDPRTSTSSDPVAHIPAKPRINLDVRRRTPPLWMYPGPGGLPEEPDSAASEILSSQLSSTEDSSHEDVYVKSVLPMDLWLQTIIKMLTGNSFEWETYSYILVHLGVQIGNHSLFVDAIKEINLLRMTVCRQLLASSFHEAPSYTSLKKSDVASCLYHLLTMLVSYHQDFTKPEEDEIVRVFVLGLGAGEGNAERCIHAISVCCHELPASIIKSLDGVLHGMSRIITQSQIAAHILEFLTGLSQSPELFKNLSQEQYGTVFAICCQYLGYARDQKEMAAWTAARQSTSTIRYSSSSRDAQQGDSRAKSLAEELPQYVYALAYRALSSWFMSLRLEDRPAKMADLTRQLHYIDNNGRQQLEEQSETTIDMMQRVSYSDRDETRYMENFAKPAEDGQVTKKHWLVGCSILTIETAGRSGKSQIIRRRASGTRYSIFQPHVVQPPLHQAPISRGSAADAYYRNDWVGIMPEDILQEFYSPLGPIIEAPVLLPDDDITNRAIGSFDRIPALDSHKIGIVYIGESQTEEAEILANVMGSADYMAFLAEIGTLTKLQGANFNTHGLDREFNMDGEFTYCWRDRVTEIVFHITTMMPSNLDRDPLGTQKKKHIGNDFVNIIFNNSGLPFNTETFPSDFNYVNIVIAPEARTTFLDTRVAQEENARKAGTAHTRQEDHGLFDSMFYRVDVYSKAGLPKISPASETKIMSWKSLATFIRPIALNASVFSSEWAAGRGSEHISTWRSRLRAIKTLRERNAPPAREPQQDTISPPGTTWGSTMATPALPGGVFSPPPAGGRDSSLFSPLPRARGDGAYAGAPPAGRESAFIAGSRTSVVDTSVYRRHSATPEIVAAAAQAAVQDVLGGARASRPEDSLSEARRGSGV